MNTEIQRVKRQKKFLKMAIAFVLGFVVCWPPLNILGFFGKDLGSEQFVVLLTHITHITIFLLLEIVPLIPVSAFTFSENFRQGLENILKRGQVGIQSL